MPRKPLTKKGPGRPKGAKNKVTSDVRQLILDAAAALQTDKRTAITQWAKENPTDFYCKVLVKVLPKDMKVEHEGEITISWRKT